MWSNIWQCHSLRAFGMITLRVRRRWNIAGVAWVPFERMLPRVEWRWCYSLFDRWLFSISSRYSSFYATFRTDSVFVFDAPVLRASSLWWRWYSAVWCDRIYTIFFSVTHYCWCDDDMFYILLLLFSARWVSILFDGTGRCSVDIHSWCLAMMIYSVIDIDRWCSWPSFVSFWWLFMFVSAYDDDAGIRVVCSIWCLISSFWYW